MNWVFASIIALTVGQTAICGFSFALFLSYVGRIIFLLRRLGTVAPYKVSVGFEAADLFFVMLGLIFTKAQRDWVSTIFMLLFCAGVCLLYVIDDRFYLYVVSEDEDEEE